MLGAAFGVLSASSFALSNVFARRGVMGLSALQGIYITVVAGVPLFFIAALVSGQVFRLGELGWSQHAWLAASGVTQYIVGRYSNYRAIRALGANGSAPLLSLSVLVSVVLAVPLLGERISLVQGVGIA
ncbi:MAG: EamA family transporter, partial [Chloroflexota bacterium]